jgi:isoquinoline 1-oxidoreductase subunit alpha
LLRHWFARVAFCSPLALLTPAGETTRPVNFKINGANAAANSEPDTPILWVLRDELGLTGTKYGCGIGQCGACTVHLDGRAIRACQTPLSEVQGKNIATIESLSRDNSHPLQKAWIAHDVPQCGYCQSGQLMCAAALLQEKKSPTDSDIDTAMAGNLCRCGTYDRIRAAIKTAANTLNRRA